MAAYKRLSLNERIRIQTLLEINTSFRQIAFDIGCHITTVSREVLKRRVEHNTFAPGNSNRCTKVRECTKNNVCGGSSVKCRNKKCNSCRFANCNFFCKEYDEYHCPKLDKPPYVCNGCKDRPHCRFRKMLYKADKADAASAALRSESRSGMNLTEEEVLELDGILSERIRRGQSLHHIFMTSQDRLSICERTAYKLLHSGKISARPIDAPRIVRMRPRKSKPQVKVDKKCRIGHTYEDFHAYIRNNPDTRILEGDTVEGTKGGKCILTLTWIDQEFQIGFIRDHNDSASVTAIVTHLYDSLGDKLFHKVIPDVWLLDNGSEFSDPSAIEKFGIRVFYCDPASPGQKGTCEVNHENIRRVLPKGTSFDQFDQGFFDFLFSHINALVRKKLNDHSAYDAFSSLYAADLNIEALLHIRHIDPEVVELKPSLVSKYSDFQSSAHANTQEVNHETH